MRRHVSGPLHVDVSENNEVFSGQGTLALTPGDPCLSNIFFYCMCQCYFI